MRHVMVTRENCLVPARSVVQLEVLLNVTADSDEIKKTWVITPSAHLMGKKGLSTGHAVISGCDTRVMMINLTSQPEWLPRGSMIGIVEESTEIQEVSEEQSRVIGHVARGGADSDHIPTEPGSSQNDTEAALDFTSQISKDLSEEERRSVLRVLDFYKGCFRGPGGPIGRCNMTEIYLDTGDAKPIYHRPNRAAWKEKEEIEK